MKYRVEIKADAIKALNTIDKTVRIRIFKWIQKNLDGTETPTAQGKALTGNYKGFWRYRVGDYRLIAEIHENTVIISIVAVGHRRDIYKV